MVTGTVSIKGSHVTFLFPVASVVAVDCSVIGPRLNNHPNQYCTISNLPRPNSQRFDSPCTNGASPAIKDAEVVNVVVEFCFRALVV